MSRLRETAFGVWMGVEELLYLLLFPHEQDGVGRQICMYQSALRSVLFWAVWVVDGRGVWPAWAGKGLVQPARAPFTIICN